MESNKKDQPSDVKLAWQAPAVVNLAADQTEGKSNISVAEGTNTTGAAYAPS